MDHRHVVEHRELLDRLLGLEGPAHPPTGAAVVRHLQEILAERVNRSRHRTDKPAEDVEERRLAGTVGSDQTAGPLLEAQAHPVERRDSTEADSQVTDFNHAFSPSVAARRPRPNRSPPRRLMSRGT